MVNFSSNTNNDGSPPKWKTKDMKWTFMTLCKKVESNNKWFPLATPDVLTLFPMAAIKLMTFGIMREDITELSVLSWFCTSWQSCSLVIYSLPDYALFRRRNHHPKSPALLHISTTGSDRPHSDNITSQLSRPQEVSFHRLFIRDDAGLFYVHFDHFRFH